jgi:hypothetical protein
MVHGSPWDEDYYIFSERHAINAFQRSDKRLIFFGHTHIPVIWSLDDNVLEGEAIPDDGYEYYLEEGKRLPLNDGIEQPDAGMPCGKPSNSWLATCLPEIKSCILGIYLSLIPFNIKTGRSQSAAKTVASAGCLSSLTSSKWLGMLRFRKHRSHTLGYPIQPVWLVDDVRRKILKGQIDGVSSQFSCNTHF